MQDGTLMTVGNLQVTALPRGNVFARDCPTRHLLDRIGDKWSVLLLLLLGDTDMRFNEMKRRVGGISQKMLSQTLRSLQRDGLVLRDVEATIPVSVTYSITPMGRELLSALRFLMEWAEVRMPDVAEAQSRHDRGYSD